MATIIATFIAIFIATLLFAALKLSTAYRAIKCKLTYFTTKRACRHLIKFTTKCLMAIMLILFQSTLAQASVKQSTHEFQLTNGLKLIIREDHRAPIIVFQVWYRVGSSYEPSGLTGISHVLEHMMFKGTNILQPGEFSELVAKFGGRENAFTSHDYTGYYQVWEKSRLPLSFELEANRMSHLNLRQEEFEKEIKVVMEERRLRVEDNPNALANERFTANAYTSSTYQQPLIGWMHDLEKITLPDLDRWYQQWYAPNNATIVIVGDVDPNQTYQLAERFFGNLEPRDLPKAANATDVTPLGERRMTIKVKTKLPTLLMSFNVPTLGSAKNSSEPYALRMLAGVLDGGYSARIETQLVRGSKIAASARTGYTLYARGDTLFNIVGIPSTGVSLEKLESSFFELIDDLQQRLADPAELKRVRAQVISNIIYQQDSISSQAESIGSLESIGLSWEILDHLTDNLKKVTPEEIKAVAERYLIRDRATIAQIIPEASTEQPPIQ